MIIYYITAALIVTLIIFITIVCYNRKRREEKKRNENVKTEADSKVEQPIVVKEKELELVEIPDFDEDTYISDTFNTVFHSLQIEDWSIEYKRDSISFIRSKVDNQSRRVSQIKLNVEFTFNHKKDKNGDYLKGKNGELQKEFTISRINLCPPDGGSGFVFQGVLKKEHLKYLYDIYVRI